MNIELLSPAKDIESGIAAIDYGADAVYIGSPKFGARAKASNSLEDISRLIEYAHKFSVKIYPVLNTILFDEELNIAESLIHALYSIGSDALIIQDMGILEMELPPLPLFASTQANNSSIKRIQFFEKVGLQRVILARELSLNEIRKIKEDTNIELEFFVHGSLCISYSGQCYFSQAVAKRSGNRGECAQPCRMHYDLLDTDGNIILKDKNIFSLKDLNLSKYLSQLIDAGIVSFKIEGRLKDISYIKNITSFYRKTIDEIIKNKKDIKKSSTGTIDLNFKPDPYKSFNRGFTSYYIDDTKRTQVASLNTEKSIGEKTGKVASLGNNYIVVDSKSKFNNGDGLCFFNDEILLGTRINFIKDNKLFLNSISGIKVGTIIYRNYDIGFDTFLSKNQLKRKIDVDFILSLEKNVLLLKGIDVDKNEYLISKKIKTTELVNNNTDIKNKIIEQLKKTGKTIFQVRNIEIPKPINISLPHSIINQLRRDVLEGLEKVRLKNYYRIEYKITPNNFPYPKEHLDYTYNVVNEKAKDFYRRHLVKNIEDGFELLSNQTDKVIMKSKYCIRFEIDKCPLENKQASNKPLFLINNYIKYRVEFNCKECNMTLWTV
jgi:putative protease